MTLISTLLLTHMFASHPMVENITNLPSPATLDDALFNADFERYTMLIKKSSEVVKWYCKLDAKERKKCLFDWYIKAQPLNEKLQVEFDASKGQIKCRYSERDRIDKGEFSKVDILRIIDGEPIFFNPSSHLRILYNSKGESGFDIVLPAPGSFREILYQAESNRFLEGYYSFQDRMKSSREKFINWVRVLK